MLRVLICFFLIVSFQPSQAQEDEQQQTVVEKYGPRRQISTIVYMGLAGAVLGLSTLSFYGRPQDHLTNIPIGFGVGVVVGTIYMTYQAATDPDEFYRETQYQYEPKFSKPWPQEFRMSDLYVRNQSPDFSYRWSF